VNFRTLILLALCAASAAAQHPSPSAPSVPLTAQGELPLAGFEDYTSPAGQTENGTLRLKLSSREAAWRPWGADGPALRAHVFAVDGETLRVPGPLIRVTVGTAVHVTLRNDLSRTLVVRGLSDRGGRPRPGPIAAFVDSVAVAPLGTTEVRFTPQTPGTYFYYGRAAAPGDRVPPRFFGGDGPDAAFVGVLIVDPPDTRPRTGERIFVITQWGHGSIPASFDPEFRFMINGRSWPHTERLSLVAGDTARWRVINASGIHHPMHLHGFHFRVDSRGDQFGETVSAAGAARMVVTETLDVGQTLRMTWVAEEPGNWILHCHLMRHMSAAQTRPLTPGARNGHGQDDGDAMNLGGLVLGITVHPAGAPNTQAGHARRLQLHAGMRPRALGDDPAYGFVLQTGDAEPEADSISIPGSTLVLTRGQPTEIVVHNRLDFPLAVHWHGLQLESRFDGVANWSGSPGSVTPPIARGDTFVVRITPPRAGTFMYHVHSEPGHELAQGLYGALLVVDHGTEYVPDVDRTIVLASLGTERFPHPAINGRTDPEPMDFRTGTVYRLRFMHISPDDEKRVSLLRDGEPVEWTPIAKDGAELPLALRRAAPAVFTPHVGETFDFTWVPRSAGDYVLRVHTIFAPGPPAFRTVNPEPHTANVLVRVR
jgi:FtsP/CotA-like multicopper oxidase with cupredoxin domain